MTPQSILHNLSGRGVRLSADAGKLKIDAPVGALTDDDRARIRSHKSELLALLAAPVERPKLGTAANPLLIRCAQMPEKCIWDDCDGRLVDRGDGLYQCDGCQLFHVQVAEDLETGPAPGRSPGRTAPVILPDPATTLALLQAGECPVCADRLDLQTKNYGVWWWCAGCRRHFREADYAEPVIGSGGIEGAGSLMTP